MLEALRAFFTLVFSDPVTNLVIVLLFVLTTLDWISGSLRAMADPEQTFKATSFDVFIRTTVSKVINLTILLIFGRVLTVIVPKELSIPGLDLSMFTAAGILYAVPFVISTGTSFLDNVRGTDTKALPTE